MGFQHINSVSDTNGLLNDDKILVIRGWCYSKQKLWNSDDASKRHRWGETKL